MNIPARRCLARRAYASTLAFASGWYDNWSNPDEDADDAAFRSALRCVVACRRGGRGCPQLQEGGRPAKEVRLRSLRRGHQGGADVGEEPLAAPLRVQGHQ